MESEQSRSGHVLACVQHRGSRRFVGNGRQEEGRTHDGWQMHGYDNDHANSSVCEGSAVKHGFKTRIQPTVSLTPGVFAPNPTNIYTYTSTCIHTHQHMHTCCMLCCVQHAYIHTNICIHVACHSALLCVNVCGLVMLQT